MSSVNPQSGQAKKKRPRRRNPPKNATNNQTAGPNVKADSKPASSSTTTPVSKLPTTASKPSTSLVAIPSRKKPTARAADDDSPIRHFFSDPRYSRFTYDPERPVMEQFYELCDLYRWDRDGPQRTEARKGIKAALVLEFNDLFGKDDNSLQTWVELATIIGLSPIPDEVNKCRELVSNLHINIVDLIEHGRLLERVRVFPTVVELSEYTRSTGRIFPRDHELAGGVLRYLLRHIVDPSLDDNRRRTTAGKRRTRTKRKPRFTA
ncbi:hypothetical protein NLI96_g586 [Meripilus lineatus]|uniref:Uncharacterized protein n=1 Tax=Meripilus lineatus TaxID=2056292 RepID=A0AAD5YJ50_9APHY|nr:hypothetical protein NLI96_g586 [Physisporinus lineatus]